MSNKISIKCNLDLGPVSRVCCEALMYSQKSPKEGSRAKDNATCLLLRYRSISVMTMNHTQVMYYLPAIVLCWRSVVLQLKHKEQKTSWAQQTQILSGSDKTSVSYSHCVLTWYSELEFSAWLIYYKEEKISGNIFSLFWALGAPKWPPIKV